MPLPRSAHLFAAPAALLISLLTTSRASAQSIDIDNENSLARFDAIGQPLPKRPVSLSPEAINLKDCREDQRIRFPVRMTGFQANAKVEIWASTGSDCSMGVNRTSIDAPCWRVVDGVPIQAYVNVDIPVRDLLSRSADESVCGTVDLTELDVQLLMFEAADYDTAVVSKHVTVIADTIGPEPPKASIFAGNGRARVEVRSSALSITAVNAYCEKSSSENACSGASLVPGREPEPARECGSVVGSVGSVFFTDPLENGERHVVAVAARDAFGNVGTLSTVTCTVPSPDAETKVQSLDEPTGCSVNATGIGATGAGTRDAALASFATCALGLMFLRARARLRRRPG